MNESDWQSLKERLSSPLNIVVIPHKNPDGDAMGSCLAWARFLEKKGHQVQVIAPNDYPKFLKWLPGNQGVLIFDHVSSRAEKIILEADLICTLDFNALSRAGNIAGVLENASAEFLMIDHHEQPDDFATYTYSVPPMSSTCEMVYHALDHLGELSSLDADMANCLYTGIMTDTGSFKYPSTTATTHRVVAHLIEIGAQHHQIQRQVFDNNSPARLALLGKSLNNMVRLEAFSTAYMSLSQEELDAAGYSKGDTEGFVNYALGIEGVVFSALFTENKEEGIIKISFRSIGDFSVNTFARDHFEGGGHQNAAGGRSRLSLQQTLQRFESLLPQYINQLQP
jgi:phosphoesterase RecJ-like protein